jgi:UDP-N-acetylmuramoylalanine--D-glutamate ligase
MKGEAAIAAVSTRTPPALDGALAAVIGFGKSGRAAASLLVRRGARVRVSDASPIEKLGVGAQDVPGGARWIGGDDPSVLEGCDLVVPSPGVPPHNPLLVEARRRGIPILAELELAWLCTSAPCVAITGTNGKTTTTELAGAIARRAGKRALVAGNVGTPLAELAGEDAELIVLEVSSFQLAFSTAFRPEVGVILNLTEDHFDWHPDFEDYAAAKRSMFERQTREDAACLCVSDREIARRFTGLPGRVHRFREAPLDGPGAFLRDGWVMLRMHHGEEQVMPIADWSLPGAHNRENLLGACLAMRLAGIDLGSIAAACRAFRGLPHRMETFATIDGVSWVDDSKATNPGSLEKALDPAVPTLLIAGGVTKGVDFRPLAPFIATGARIVYAIGEGAAEIDAAWGGVTRVVRARTLEEAVRLAKRDAREGERVLLSPACASFDQFRNYAHRGERFQELVRGTTEPRPEGGGR